MENIKEKSHIKRAIEALVLVSPEPASNILLAQLLDIPVDQVKLACNELSTEYKENNRGFELVEVAGGWRYQTCRDLSEYMERYAMEAYSPNLSAAALETLSIIAYKQPISRAQVSAVRGVNADGVMKTLQAHGYIEELGKGSDPGRALVYGTTNFFLEQLGLNSLEDLPPLGDFVPSAEVLEIFENSLEFSLSEAAQDSIKESSVPQ